MTNDKIIERYLKKQCEFAGVDYDTVQFDDVEWTREERRAFISWMIDDLKAHKVIRKRLEVRDKSGIPDFVGRWVARYGFKMK
jgi:hypothetical protein